MEKECVLYDRVCIACGECEKCDLDSTKICDNCMRCVKGESEYLSLPIDDIEAPEEAEKL